jgi:hypothetical protein
VSVFRGQIRDQSSRESHQMSAEGLILHSVAGGRGDGDSWDRWRGPVQMLVRTDEGSTALAAPVSEMTRAKYPIAGTTLPLVPDPADPSGLRIDWNAVLEIDQWIEYGHPVFTNPMAVHVALLEAMHGHQTVATDAIDQRIASGLGPGAPFDHDSMVRALHAVRAAAQAEEAGSTGTSAASTIPAGQPKATILAVSPSPGTPFSYHGEVLLSVALPGRARYGVRWTGMVGGIRPGQLLVGGLRKLDEWTELPVTVHDRDPAKVEIEWDAAPDVIDAVAGQLHAIRDRLQARIDDPSSWLRSMEPMLAAIPDPQQQAEVRRQIAEAMARPGPWGAQLGAAAPQGAAVAPTEAAGTPGPASASTASADGPLADPLDELGRLAQERAAGTITQAEFEAAKARLLRQI